MIHPIPSGTRDVLPDETREVRAITDTLRGVFERHRYGEIYTPALEYESVLARADMAEAQPAYRVFDETGAVLVLRSDMTVPIARAARHRRGDHAALPRSRRRQPQGLPRWAWRRLALSRPDGQPRRARRSPSAVARRARLPRLR